MSARRSIRTVGIASRIGGDGSACLAPEQDPANALKLGERLNAAAAEEVATPDEPPVGLSIGAVSCPEHGTDAETLIDVADKAMYRAKAAGDGVALGEPQAEPTPERQLPSLAAAPRAPGQALTTAGWGGDGPVRAGWERVTSVHRVAWLRQCHSWMTQCRWSSHRRPPECDGTPTAQSPYPAAVDAETS